MRPSGGSPLILAFAFRRIPAWRDSWLSSRITVPAIVLANVVYSAVGNGAGTRAGTVALFVGPRRAASPPLAAPSPAKA